MVHLVMRRSLYRVTGSKVELEKWWGFFGAGGVLLDKLGVWIIPDGQEDGDPSYVVDQ